MPVAGGSSKLEVDIDSQRPKKKRRRVRSSSASSSSSTAYVVATRTAPPPEARTRKSSPVSSSSSPEVPRRLVKNKQKSPSSQRPTSSTGHVPNSLSDPEDVEDFILPPSLRASEAQPSQKAWQPRSRPRALPSLTQLGDASQTIQPDPEPGGMAPIVSDGTLTGTDSPAALPRLSVPEEQVYVDPYPEQELYNFHDDFFMDGLELPPPLKRATPPPSPKEAKGAVDDNLRSSPGPEAGASAAEASGLSRESAPKTLGADAEDQQLAALTQPHLRDDQAPKQSKYFEKSNKRRRTHKARESESDEGEAAPFADEADPSNQVVTSSKRKKGKRRMKPQSDEEDEATAECLICGHMFPLTALLEHQTACYAEDTAGQDYVRSLAARQHGNGSDRSLSKVTGNLQPFRPTNPPVEPASSGRKRKSAARTARESTIEMPDSPVVRPTTRRSARRAQSARAQAPQEVISLDDEDDDDEIEISDVEIVQRGPARSDKGKGKGTARMRDESPPAGSIFISKLPEKIKQGYYRMLKRDEHGDVLYDSDDQIARPAKGARIASTWPIGQERERKSRPPTRGKSWGDRGATRGRYVRKSGRGRKGR